MVVPAYEAPVWASLKASTVSIVVDQVAGCGLVNPGAFGVDSPYWGASSNDLAV